jgi:lipopolysaccharide transport system ATP-binding protein
MEDIAVKAEHLSKKYVIRHEQRDSHPTFRGLLSRTATSWGRRLAHVSAPPSQIQSPREELWALDDLCFEIRQGEKLGIVGANGAGKTTLLKILGKITRPTSGRVRVWGIAASLIEVGTGFHPELTGRENIYLNGALLGMRKAEIDRKFDEIVAFAETERLLDTPVKRYSSGMYVRLAFAVAAHLEPDILLVDEVLAVGDRSFQRKCLGKMDDISRGGRTVLFVSHNMGAVRALCRKALWLDRGRVEKIGPAHEVIQAYEDGDARGSSVCRAEREWSGPPRFHCKQVDIMDGEGRPQNIFRYGDTLVLLVELGGPLSIGRFSTEFYLYNQLGQLVSVGASGQYHGKHFEKQVRRVRIRIGPLNLTSGDYRVTLSLMSGVERIDTWENAIGFTIAECQPFSTGWDIPTHREGVCVLGQEFEEAE